MYVLAQHSVADETRLLVEDRRLSDHSNHYAYMTEDEFNALQTYRGHIGSLIHFRTRLGMQHFLHKHPKIKDREIVHI